MFGRRAVDGRGRYVVAVAFDAGEAAVGRGAWGAVAGDVDGGEDEFFLLRCGQDFVEVDGDAEGDEEEASDAAADPVGGLQGRGRDELGPEGLASVAEEDGAGGFLGGGYAGYVLQGGVDFVDVGLCGSDDVVEGVEWVEVKNRLYRARSVDVSQQHVLKAKTCQG